MFFCHDIISLYDLVSFPFMLAAFIVSGIGNTIVQVSANPLLHDVSPREKYSSYMSLSQFMLEIREQLKAANLSIDYVVFASSSGGTHAGLLAGCELYQVDSKIIGINIDKDETQGKTLEEIIRELIPGVLEFHNRKPGHEPAGYQADRGL